MATVSVAVGDVLTYQYTGAVQSDTLPPGTYQLECWGAQGGDKSTSYKGGRGGYSIGTLTIEEETTLYMYVGGQGTTASAKVAYSGGGFNGGGNIMGSTSGSSYLGTGGGGASDIRIATDSLYARIIVAGGGGGLPGRYNNASQAGHGGGTSGGNSNSSNSSYYGGRGGTATARGISYDGTSTSTSDTQATFGNGAYGGSSSSTSGVYYQYAPGGGGWYGGGFGRRSGGGGGSGYVYTESTASNYPSGCLLNKSYYLTDASTTIGTTSGHAGDGEIVITVLDLPSTKTSPTTTIPQYVGEKTSHNIYGVYWDGSANSHMLRTDNAALFSDPQPAVNNGDGSSPFDDIMPWSGMKRVEDSEAGTLVSIPKFYYRWIRDNKVDDDMQLQITMEPLEGFHVSPAHADREDGVGERDWVYVGAYHCANSTYKSTSGVLPQASITRTTARTNIHNLGTNVWQWDYAMLWTIRMLYLVEFADWNSQAKIGYGCGNNSSRENTGSTDSMPYHTGTMQSSRTTYGVGCQYRYIEDLWGNVMDWCDGIYFNDSTVYGINNPANFSDSSGGTNIGTRATSSNCIKAWTNPSASGFEYALYPSETVSDSNYATYICDRCHYGSSGVVVCVGGNYYQYQYYGLFYMYGYNVASYSSGYIGSRLMKLPAEQIIEN